ncbi:protein phosphatase 1G-like [Gouania willdenowi]|uniref:protein phosphatase 1G-like n=1 Tax=Gouania willdenowi TaxID=441366 RepID=UPI00105676FD|nr:protein phosphatase 1G-like [Gouania willdenowi]
MGPRMAERFFHGRAGTPGWVPGWDEPPGFVPSWVEPLGFVPFWYEPPEAAEEPEDTEESEEYEECEEPEDTEESEEYEECEEPEDTEEAEEPEDTEEPEEDLPEWTAIYVYEVTPGWETPEDSASSASSDSEDEGESSQESPLGRSVSRKRCYCSDFTVRYVDTSEEPALSDCQCEPGTKRPRRDDSSDSS